VLYVSSTTRFVSDNGYQWVIRNVAVVRNFDVLCNKFNIKYEF
jgi:hypothetical protein